jgi:hypothetical protein
MVETIDILCETEEEGGTAHRTQAASIKTLHRAVRHGDLILTVDPGPGRPPVL